MQEENHKLQGYFSLEILCTVDSTIHLKKNKKQILGTNFKYFNFLIESNFQILTISCHCLLHNSNTSTVIWLANQCHTRNLKNMLSTIVCTPNTFIYWFPLQVLDKKP